MKTSLLFIFSVLLVVLIVSSSCAPVTSTTEATTVIATPSSPATVSLPTATVPIVETVYVDLIPEDITTSVRAMVDQDLNVGIVVGIVSPRGKEVFSYGKTALDGDQEVDENTIFELGSIGKVFTTLLLAVMVEKGELSFEDPIENFLPDDISVPIYNGQSIRLIDLATHTSGLPGIPENLAPADEYNPYADYSIDQMYTALSEVTLSQEPGKDYEYSNFGMGLLGHILSLHSGMSYEELVVHYITDELGMPDTRVDLTTVMQDHLAHGYREGELFPLWDNPTLAGAGALRSSVKDMLTFLAANVGLKESSLFEAMKVTHEPRFPVGPSMEVGLAWHMSKKGDNLVIEHHGATGGYWSFAGFIMEEQTAVVVLTNTFQDIDEIGLGLLETATTNP